MQYEIVAIHDQMPSGRARKAKTDKYAEQKQLLDQIPEDKVAQIPITKLEYRAFSAGVRAAGVQVGKRVDCSFKRDAAFVRWVPLTDENRPKRRGGRRRTAVV